MREREREIGPTILETLRIVNRREGDLVEAFVPISLVYREDVPVDEAHVKELADSIQQEASRRPKRTGQLSPILLGEIPGFSKLPIIDGFHRVPALELLGMNEVFATIRPNCTWEEVIDLRILAATTHRHVRFARLIEWIEEAWKFTSWQERIKSRQAFQLACVPKITGVKIGLTPEEIKEIKEWVGRKCAQWHISPSYVYQHLITAQLADPELVKEVRERKGGWKLEALTPQHLKEVSRTLPYRFELQRLVAQTAKAQKLTVFETGGLALAVARAKTPEEAQKIIASRNWKDSYRNIYPDSYTPARTSEIKSAATPNPELLEEFFQAEMRIAELTIENAVLSGRYPPQPTTPDKTDNLEVPDGKKPAKVGPKVDPPPISPLSDEQIKNIMAEIENSRPSLVAFLSKRFEIRGDDAEDIIQEAQLKTLMHMKRGRFKYGSEKGTHHWMLTVVHNIAISTLRKRSYEEKKAIKASREAIPIEQSNTTEDGDNLQLIKQVLPLIPVRWRRVFVLRELFHLSHFEIAQITGESTENSRALVFRAREYIKDLLLQAYK